MPAQASTGFLTPTPRLFPIASNDRVGGGPLWLRFEEQLVILAPIIFVDHHSVMPLMGRDEPRFDLSLELCYQWNSKNGEKR